MKKSFLIMFSVAISMAACNAQKLGGLDKMVPKLPGNGTATGASLTEGEVANGLKEALQSGIQKGVAKLNVQDGFLGSVDYKIFLPEEAKKMEQKLRSIGMGADVDRAITSMNRGAEKAVGEAKNIFVQAITAMTIQDAMSILRGGDGKATDYLQQNTSTALRAKFEPIIQSALDQVGALKYWETITTAYNKLPLVTPVTTDLKGHVTDKAMYAVFDQIRKEENLIRKDPVARTTDLLKKVFGAN